jgi:hypothetical protein
MGIPYTRVNIISNALLLLGKPRIESIEAGGPPAKAADQLFDQILAADLSSPNWRFATKTATLSVVANFDPDFAGFTYAQQLPADCLAIWRLWPNVYYQVFGQRLYTSTNTQLKIEYRSMTDLGALPPAYLNYLTYLIADTLAPAITDSATVSGKISAQMAAAKAQAMVVNAQNNPNRSIASSPWLGVRTGGGWGGGFGGGIGY